MRRPKPTKPIMPFMLGAIYRKTDAQDLLGIGTNLMRRLHREGRVELRRIGNKDYVRSDDIWNAMVKVPPSRGMKSETTENATETPISRCSEEATDDTKK